MFDAVLDNLPQRFRTCDEVRPLIRKACYDNADLARYELLGQSEEGRPIDAVVLGTGETTVSLIAGAHSDEPAGPETLRLLITEVLNRRADFADLLQRYRFAIVPHINPDGEAQNLRWMREWPDVESYIRNAFREPPGRDLEFGFPEMRVENQLVSGFLKQNAPVALHMSLHGMGIAEGAMLLIEKNWIDRTQDLRERYRNALQHHGVRLHDHDRKGEKGFQYIEPGFSTTPEGTAMRAYFESMDDPGTANQFHDSSMEFVGKLGGAPLCLVTEIPLFQIGKRVAERTPGVPTAYLEFKEKLPGLRAKALQNLPITGDLAEFQLTSVAIPAQIKLQLRALELGLEAINARAKS